MTKKNRLKYSYLEEILGNYAGARQIYERWMEWQPDEQAWLTYIKFEMRCGETERARGIYERFVKVHPSVKAWLRWAKFEDSLGERDRARAVFEQAVQYLGENANDEKLFIAFAAFEERCKEVKNIIFSFIFFFFLFLHSFLFETHKLFSPLKKKK
jgi:crooked neck